MSQLPLLIEGFLNDQIVPGSTSINKHVATVNRGRIIGIDLVPVLIGGGNNAQGMFFDLNIGSQIIIRKGIINEYRPPVVGGERVQYPIPVEFEGGQTMEVKQDNVNGLLSLESQLLVFYENQYDTGNLNFDVPYGNKLRLKRQSFVLTSIPSGNATVSGTIPKENGKIIGISPELTSTIAGLNVAEIFYTLLINGVEIIKFCAAGLFQSTGMYRRWGVFPIDIVPGSTFEMRIDSTRVPTAVEMATTFIFEN